ncbi:uncharacterized protein LOC118204976 [Stegodyphus dumicola]|uniref:uncharacterized protein LOC118204976 n=1 Tax=Stegodyphus dumicola TaxID=202533 RepID=UPI0015AA4D97|nr:uncharacterized protein LOC118204976 [Stegodyphus dumicola]
MSVRIFGKFVANFKLCLSNSARSCSYIHDKNFYYFRCKDEYKNSVVLLNNDLNNSKVESCEFSLPPEQNIHNNDSILLPLMQRENVMKLSTSQIKEVMCLMANTKVDISKYTSAVKYLDEKCALGVERWPLELSLYMLDAWIIVLGPKAFRKHYYSAVTSVWSRKVTKCSKVNLVLMLYFIGLSKSRPPFLMEILESKLETFISDFSDEEWAIICLSFFKISKRIKSELLLKQSCHAAVNLLQKNDRFNLISVLKILRMSKFYDSDLWNKLQDYVLKEHNSFNFVECTNFLAVFADQNIYYKELFNCLENQGMSVLLNETVDSNIKAHPSMRSRVKDIARFLWALASVGHDVKASNRNSIINILDERLQSGEINSQLHILVDSLQSLILLGCYPNKLLSFALQAACINTIFLEDKAKPKYQLYFIQKSVQIEDPLAFCSDHMNILHPIPKNLQKDIMNRKGFKAFTDYLEKKLIKNDFECCYLIPHIMIAGIVISSSDKNKLKNSAVESKDEAYLYKKYAENGIISKHLIDFLEENKCYTCIEILDPSVCIHGSIQPIGLMQTKIRQLTKLNFQVITLSTDEIEVLIKRDSVPCKKIAYLIN